MDKNATLVKALQRLLEHYLALANSGTEEAVIEAREALKNNGEG